MLTRFEPRLPQFALLGLMAGAFGAFFLVGANMPQPRPSALLKGQPAALVQAGALFATWTYSSIGCLATLIVLLEVQSGILRKAIAELAEVGFFDPPEPSTDDAPETVQPEPKTVAAPSPTAQLSVGLGATELTEPIDPEVAISQIQALTAEPEALAQELAGEIRWWGLTANEVEELHWSLIEIVNRRDPEIADLIELEPEPEAPAVFPEPEVDPEAQELAQLFDEVLEPARSHA